ncbi:unnamed protein product [Phytophthora fragariaefolia]|uniref:Unnamed protein product n=1 Tax=Phytophthora fragariaefolia TaxID=1490495 RepID=A0A9W6TQA1_9STRA|nr:unnamed protein product [Phytophthora fragariaefolia]
MLTRTLSTTAYSRTTKSVDNNLGAATDERTDAECLASIRNGSACWTVGDNAEPEAVLAFQRILAAAPVHAQRTAVLLDAPWPIDRPGSGSIILPEDTHRTPLHGFSEC